MNNKIFSLNMRFWHWLNATGISLLLLTVFLRKTFLNIQANQALILQKTQEMGLSMTAEQARAIARSIRLEMWQWHPKFGMAVIALLIYRLVIYFNERKNEKIPAKNLQEKFAKITYQIFYAAITLMGITGMLLFWDESLHLSDGMIHQLEEIHETIMWYIIFFVIVHLVGVIKSEFQDKKGIISAMFNGGNK